MINLNTFKRICFVTLIISIFIPFVSLAQESSDQTASQELTANSYGLDTPPGFDFEPVFVRPDEGTQAQRVLDPSYVGERGQTELLKFTDLRGRSGGPFNIYAYMTDLRTAGRGEDVVTISVDNIGIATRTTSNIYSIDFDEDNFLAPEQETVSAPLDYNGALTGGEIPEEEYTFFTSAEEGILIMNGSENPAIPGSGSRTGSYALAPALIINIPENSYGNFSGTMTFEIVLS